MDPIAVNSSNTLVDGGKVAGDDIPKDGTGTVTVALVIIQCADKWKQEL
jgi:hypothetical protein